MDPRLDEILRLVSPACAVALRDLMMLHVLAARTNGYYAAPVETMKKVKKQLAEVPDADLGVCVLRLSAAEFGGVRPFFEAEGSRRSGRINEWVFRGVLPDHTPDILTLTIVRETAATVPEPLVNEPQP